MGTIVRAVLMAVALVWSLGGAAWGQTAPASPMMTHYRAYLAANERGDVYEAEKEAAAALAAAEAVNSPRIGVLATNLARVRALQQRDFAGALAPAQRALEVGGEGVDRQQARILAALALLPTNQNEKSSDALAELLTAAAAAPGADFVLLYQAADVWAEWLLAQERLRQAVRAYTMAGEFASAIGPDAGIEKSRALTGLGIAYLYLDNDSASFEALTAALETAAPLAPESTGRAIPPGEIAFLNASAWRSTLRAKVKSEGRRPLPDGPAILRPVSPGPPRCQMQLVRTRPVEDPRVENGRLNVGTIILRYRVTEDGQIQDVQIAASAPSSRDFGPAVVAAVQSWRVTWVDPTPNCRRATDDGTYTASFTIDASPGPNSANRVRR